jgi:hypothetical protein
MERERDRERERERDGLVDVVNTCQYDSLHISSANEIETV